MMSTSVTRESRKLSLALAITTSLAVGGCGSGPPPGPSAHDQIATTITTFSRAVADGDAQIACAQIAPGFQAFPGHNVPCSVAMTLASQHLSEQQKTLLRAIQIKGISVVGKQATATILYGHEVQHPKLQQYAGRWLIVQSSSG